MVDEMGNKVIDLGRAHLGRMSLVVIEDELADPAGVGPFRAQGVMQVAEGFAIAVEKFFARRVGRGRRLG